MRIASKKAISKPMPRNYCEKKAKKERVQEEKVQKVGRSCRSGGDREEKEPKKARKKDIQVSSVPLLASNKAQVRAKARYADLKKRGICVVCTKVPAYRGTKCKNCQRRQAEDDYRRYRGFKKQELVTISEEYNHSSRLPCFNVQYRCVRARFTYGGVNTPTRLEAFATALGYRLTIMAEFHPDQLYVEPKKVKMSKTLQKFYARNKVSA